MYSEVHVVVRISSVLHNKESHTGLERHKGEKMMTELKQIVNSFSLYIFLLITKYYRSFSTNNSILL